MMLAMAAAVTVEPRPGAWQVDASIPMFVFLGRLDAQKGVDVMFESIDKVGCARPPTHPPKHPRKHARTHAHAGTRRHASTLQTSPPLTSMVSTWGLNG